MDNAKEFNKIIDICKKRGIIVEITSPHTPQFNGVVERAFATIKTKATACLSWREVDEENRASLWAHVTYDTVVTNNMLPRKGYANAYEPFGDGPPVKT